MQIDHRYDASHDHGPLGEPPLFEVGRIQRRARRAKSADLCGDLVDAAPRSDRLIIRFQSGFRRVGFRPFCVDRIGEGGAGAIDLGRSGAEAERGRRRDAKKYEAIGVQGFAPSQRGRPTRMGRNPLTPAFIGAISEGKMTFLLQFYDKLREHGAGDPAGRGRKNTVKTEPIPGVLSISRAPRWWLRMCLTIAKPSPVPPSSRERALSTRHKRS